MTVCVATTGEGIEPPREAIHRSLDMIRVHSKLPTAKEADRERPFTVRRGSQVIDMAGQLHKDFIDGLTFARV